MTTKRKTEQISPRAKLALQALRRAAKQARKIAKLHGTPVYFMRDGKIVAEKP